LEGDDHDVGIAEQAADTGLGNESGEPVQILEELEFGHRQSRTRIPQEGKSSFLRKPSDTGSSDEIGIFTGQFGQAVGLHQSRGQSIVGEQAHLPAHAAAVTTKPASTGTSRPRDSKMLVTAATLFVSVGTMCGCYWHDEELCRSPTAARPRLDGHEALFLIFAALAGR
jgi:hypothetical protein